MKELEPGPRCLHDILEMSEARGLPHPTPDGVPCCDASAMLGPEHCTCWERVHDQVQALPILDMEPATRPQMCGDCAFRPGSPERTDADEAICDSGDLMVIVHDPAQQFWCHDGLRSISGLRHPNGMQVDREPVAGVVAYDPPIVDGVPYQADGQPAFRCAGLAAARRAKDWTP